MEEGFLSVQNIDLLHHVAIWKTFSGGKASCIVQFTFDRISLPFFITIGFSTGIMRTTSQVTSIGIF